LDQRSRATKDMLQLQVAADLLVGGPVFCLAGFAAVCADLATSALLRGRSTASCALRIAGLAHSGGAWRS
jgi:hypothetical protein